MVTITRGYVSIKETILIYTATQVVTFGASGSAADFVDFNPHHHAGGDGDGLGVPAPLLDFNPHHHAGGDMQLGDVQPEQKQISIHTTTQVVTICRSLCHGHLRYFNPHHHAGGDDNTTKSLETFNNFNPHHHLRGGVD